MRPTRIELEGFTAFREPTTVDLSGVDLFALCGPTGAGKSSIVDALCFALYGAVPRYADRRRVAPVINQQRNEARVRLDFTVGGEAWTAVRVVRRTPKGGATTREARLERGAEVVAGTADDVTDRVEALLGLTFAHFTRCVVLPQGEFAAFLHESPANRQDVLVRLLDLGRYEQVGQLARGRAAAERARREQLEERLGELADASPEALAAARRDVKELAAVRDRVDAARPDLERLAAAATEAERRATEADERAALLAGPALPADLEAVATAVADATARAREAAAATAEAEAATAALEEQRGGLPAAEALREVLADHEALARERARATRGATVVAEAADALAAAQARVERAERVLAGAAERREAARRHDHARALLAGLNEGDECPVCRRRIDALPEAAELDDLVAADRAHGEAESELAAARQAAAEAAERHTRAVATLDGVDERIAELERRLAGQPGPDHAAARLEEVARVEQALDASRRTERAAREDQRGAEAAVDAARRAEADARRRFERARDRVAALGPPEPGREDLVADWEALVRWAADQRDAERAAAARHRAEAAEAGAERDRRLAALRAELEDAGVDAGTATDPRDAVVEALARAEAAARHLEEAATAAARLGEEVAAHREREQVAEELGRHLTAKGFERWLLDEALAVLLEGASTWLRRLSSDAYSLDVDDQGGFSVVDHREADAVRPARTLSGGETFLASLALALALADELSQLAERGAARLDAVFLDEGFGTLDVETLDVVASAIEDLGARGRMVGLISHVPELAERVPVRFEVRREPHTATVERVER